MKNSSQKGTSLVFAVTVLVIALAIVLGLTVVVIGQLKVVRGLGNSVVAFYAADTGVEQALEDIYDRDGFFSSQFSNSLLMPSPYPAATYTAEVFCCNEGQGNCLWSPAPEPLYPAGNGCPSGLAAPVPPKKECLSSRFCVRSVGGYRDTKRAIEVEI